MTSSSGRFVMAFNGEIYNHLEIRAELENSSQSGVGLGQALQARLGAFQAGRRRLFGRPDPLPLQKTGR